jgi:hypothetical protein
MKTAMTVAEVSQFVSANSNVSLTLFWKHVAGGDMHPMSQLEVQRAIRQIEELEEDEVAS